MLGAVTVLVAGQAIAQALDTADTPSPVVGNATWFSGLGSPYGGCGLPQDVLDSQDFVALNVFNTPGDYANYSRPLTGANVDKMGMWNNGHNCGRWVKVTIDDYCTGTNDGAPGKAFCRNGSWVADKYNGATLTMLVADSCGDANGWCRDDPYHLDLAHDSLNRFQLDGAPVGDLDPAHWNNRQVSWEFVSAPGYSGDIKIGFLQGAQRYWGAVSLSHLANGLHGVQYYSAGAWHDATMNGDMGQSYVLKPIVEAGADFRIRAKDASDAWINNGREYSFSLPASCSGQCSAAYTPVSYTTNEPESTPSPTPTPVVPPTTPNGTTSPAPAVSPVTSTPAVSATNLFYNATIAPGSSIGIGFVANRTGSAAAPASYSLNGVDCTTS